MKTTIIAGCVALLLATGEAQAQGTANKILEESARKARAAARCEMELMKYEAMGQNLDRQSSFFMVCMRSEGYVFTSDKSKYPILNNMSCGERWKRDGRPPEDEICWLPVW